MFASPTLAPMTPRRRYDHRIRGLVALSGDLDLFPELHIPRSTARSWIRRGPSRVVALDRPHNLERALRERVTHLERRLAVVTAAMTLLLALVRTFELRLDRARLPEAADKARLLHAIERARRALPLGAGLRVLWLTASRHHGWVRAQACALDDRASCPGTTPSRLTARELLAMKTSCSTRPTRPRPSALSPSSPVDERLPIRRGDGEHDEARHALQSGDRPSQMCKDRTVGSSPPWGLIPAHGWAAA